MKFKNGHIFQRGYYALSGIISSLRSEESFRSQVACLFFIFALLIVTRPAAIWWAVIILTCGCVLAVELVNTAVEKLVDHLHPDIHPSIKIVKDTLAGAVLVTCGAAALVFLAFLCFLLWGN